MINVVAKHSILSIIAIVSIVFASILLSIESVLTEEEQISFKDEPREEKLRFFNSLTNEQFAKIKDYIDSAPKMIYDAKWDCEACNKPNERRLSSIDDFFS